MKVKRIISKSKSGKQMEVITTDDNKTHHIHKERGVWRCLVASDKEGRKVYAPITVLKQT